MRAGAGRVYAGTGIAFFCLYLLLNGCKSYQSQDKELPDTRDRGTINISADESFRPIIDAQVQVYESNHPGTTIRVQYKPEAECLKDFATDSIRMIITTRGFSENEKSFIVDSVRIAPEKMVVARDAIAVIVHPDAPDSLFTMQELRQILTGRFKKNLIPVFDGVQATSTVRFIVDSVLRSDSLSPNTLAARTSEGVIDYVATHPGAVGFIGVSWIGNRDDEQQVSFLKKVKMAQLESRNLPGKYILPVQANIYYNRYPLVRDLVYILKENYKGLGHGFADFMSGEIGQLIFKRAYLMPAQRNFRIRPVRLRQ
jgi:phosphate transport system substrate-binding protein